MVTYTHTRIFQSAADGFTCAAPTYFTGRQSLPTYPFVVWVCVHKTKSWINLSKQYNSASAAIIQIGCTTVSPKGSHMHILLAMWGKELLCVVFVYCTGCIQGTEKQEKETRWKKLKEADQELIVTESDWKITTPCKNHLYQKHQFHQWLQYQTWTKPNRFLSPVI